MASSINQDEGSYGAMRKFIRLSRKVTGTNLNKQPSARTDNVGEGDHLRGHKGLARGNKVDVRLSTKPLTIRKKISGNGKAPSAPKKKLPARNKGMVGRYK